MIESSPLTRSLVPPPCRRFCLFLPTRSSIRVVAFSCASQGVQASVHTRNLKGSNALIAAAMKGHTSICRLLLARGADVNQCTDSHDTALSLAIWQNHTDVCLLLIHAGANVDNVDQFGDNSMTDAAKHGNTAVMELLLEKQTLPIDHANKKGETALIRAAWKGELAALTLLLDRGANPCLATRTGCTALIMACMHNNRACARVLIERDTSPINAVDETGRSAFAYLALYTPQQSNPPARDAHGQLLPPEEPFWEAMMMLLERHVAIDTPENMGNLLLCRAANINHHALAALLLREGADINFCDPVNKYRPALLAHLQGAPDLQCTRFLVSHHAHLDYQDSDGHSGLMFAIKHNNPEIVGFLLDAGASILLENKAGETASSMAMNMIHALQNQLAHLQMIAAQTPDGIPPFALLSTTTALDRAQKCLALLMDRSAREMGSAALLLQAAQHGDEAKLSQYLSEGVLDASGTLEKVDVNFSDKTGRSALMLAAKSNHVACVKLLLQQGALLNLRDKDGLTALTLAIRSGSRECAELLAETIQSHSLSRYGGGFHFYAGPPPGAAASSFASASAEPGGTAAQLATNSQIFGLRSPPQQMALEEFDASTKFLRTVAQQLQTYLTHGKQAVREQLAAAQSQQASHAMATGSAGVPSKPAAVKTDVSSLSSHHSTRAHTHGASPSPLNLVSPPSAGGVRSSSAYLTSFPSPTAQSLALNAASVGGRRQQSPTVETLLPVNAFAAAAAAAAAAAGSSAGAAAVPAVAAAPPSDSASAVPSSVAAAAAVAVPLPAPSLPPALDSSVGSSFTRLSISTTSPKGTRRSSVHHTDEEESTDDAAVTAISASAVPVASTAASDFPTADPPPSVDALAAAQLFANASSFDNTSDATAVSFSNFGAAGTGFPQMSPTSDPTQGLPLFGSGSLPNRAQS